MVRSSHFSLRKLTVFYFTFLCYIHNTNAKSDDKIYTGLRRSGQKLKADFVEDQFNSTGMVPCINMCSGSREMECRTVSWNSKTQQCLLGSTDVTNDAFARQRLSQDNDWNTYSWKQFTVFVAKYKSVDLHTFNQSNQLCLEHGTTMAGPDDLLYSHSLGFGYNKCTWMSNRDIGYIRREWDAIRYCPSDWNPWVLCILN